MNILEAKTRIVLFGWKEPKSLLLSVQKKQNRWGGFRTRCRVVQASLWRLRNSAKASDILAAPRKPYTTQPGSCRYPRPHPDTRVGYCPLLSPGSDDVTNNNLTSRGLFEDAPTCQWHVGKPEFRRRLFIFTAAYQGKGAGLEPFASFQVKLKRSGFGSLAIQRTRSFSREG